MEDFWFYIRLGFEHVLDLSAYDHILFLTALALPFRFKNWRKVLVLATIFTVAHCLSLALSVYDVCTLDVALIEFLIPVTIFLTALLNIVLLYNEGKFTGGYSQLFTTAFFGLIHGFGFSNYFKLLMAEESRKMIPLLGFATGIEASQIVIVCMVLMATFLFRDVFGVKKKLFVAIASILVLLVTIPMLIETFPQ